MVTGLTDSAARAVAVTAVRRSTVLRSVAMASLTAPMDASFADVLVS